MSWASSEVVNVLTFLLPGLVTAVVFHSLTSYPKPNELDRVVHALAFTIVIQAIVEALSWAFQFSNSVSQRISDSKTLVAVVSGLLLAVCIAYLFNHDIPYRFLRWLRVTKENSYPSEWYSAFYRHSQHYVVLHMVGQRRLYGWPEEWPSRPDQGHFRIAEGEWLVDNNRIPAEGVEVIVVPAKDVEMVEFMKKEM